MGIVRKIVDAVEGPPHLDADADPEVRGEAAGVTAEQANALDDRAQARREDAVAGETGLPGASGGASGGGVVTPDASSSLDAEAPDEEDLEQVTTGADDESSLARDARDEAARPDR